MIKLFSRYAVEFNGSGSITIPDRANIRVGNTFMIVVQFKPKSVSEQTILKKDGEYIMKIDSSGRLAFGVYDGTDYEPMVIGGEIEVDSWYKVIVCVEVVGDYIQKTMYVNSTENKYVEFSQNGIISETANSLIIGEGFVGAIDRFMMYSRVFDESRIADILNDEFIPYDMTAFFSIEEGSGNITYDVVSSGYAGTITNGVWVMGRDMENVYKSKNKVVLVRKYM